jgi:hypothetical protein
MPLLRKTSSKAYAAQPAAASSIVEPISESTSKKKQPARYEDAWRQEHKVGQEAIQRTFELNNSAVDDVLLNPLDIQREQLIRTLLLDEEEKSDRGEPWGHPMGEAGGLSGVLRFARYWLGPFGSAAKEMAYCQPSNDLVDHLEACYITPVMCFDAFFGVCTLELSLGEPENELIVEHIAWKISTIIFAIAAPFALMLPPVMIMHVRIMASVSRPRLRKFIGKWNAELSRPHGLRIWIWCLTMVGAGLRAFATHATYDTGNRGWGTAVGVAWLVAVCICFLLTKSTVDMWYSAWLPWEEARQAAEHREKEAGDEAFFFDVTGRKLKPIDGAQAAVNSSLVLQRLKRRATSRRLGSIRMGHMSDTGAPTRGASGATCGGTAGSGTTGTNPRVVPIEESCVQGAGLG